MYLLVARGLVLATSECEQGWKSLAPVRSRYVDAAGSVAGLAAMLKGWCARLLMIEMGSGLDRPHFAPGVTAQTDGGACIRVAGGPFAVRWFRRLLRHCGYRE